MPFLATGASSLYFESFGSGPALVFSHGVGGNHAGWFAQIAALSASYRVIVWDHRGFGRSSDIEGLGRSAFVNDLNTVLNGAGVGRCVLIGQSMGGGTSLGYACAYPERIAGLVMADSLMAAELPAECAGRFRELEIRNSKLSQIERVLGETTRRENPSAAIFYTRLAAFNSVSLKTLKGSFRTCSASDLNAAAVPTLFVVGSEDILFPPWVVRAFQMQITNSRLVELAHSGHSAFFERPEAFNAVLQLWLDDIGFSPAAHRGAPPADIRFLPATSRSGS